MAKPFSETTQPTTLQAGAHGSLRGLAFVADDGHVKARRFCAVPYAKPPVGDLRWRKPVPLPADADWSGVDGTDFGGLAAQPEYAIKNDAGESLPLNVPGARLSEDCLTCNIWTPAADVPVPSGGFPVLMYIHGGWLQIGSPGFKEGQNPTELIDEVVKCVVVMPAYRLNVFGFLAGKELEEENSDGTSGNFGFWDQRLAIEWVAANIHHFSGDPSNITVSGLSAGSYSTEIQLAYELNNPKVPQHIRRVMMYSNALPAQPKDVTQSQAGFDGLCEAFKIDTSLSSEAKMTALRNLDMQQVTDMLMKLKIHTFRAVTDGAFVSRTMYADILSGDFAKRAAARGVSFIIGETMAEEYLYGATNPPSSLADLSRQLQNYYADDVVDKLVSQFELPPAAEFDSADAAPLRKKTLGLVVAHGQVYVPTRALVKTLLEGGVPKERVLRYRVAWRPEATKVGSIYPDQVSHADDNWAWFYNSRSGWTDSDTAVNKEWLAPVVAFLAGDEAAAAQGWYAGEAPSDGRRMREVRDGRIAVVDDERWERCMAIAKAIE